MVKGISEQKNEVKAETGQEIFRVTQGMGVTINQETGIDDIRRIEKNTEESKRPKVKQRNILRV